MARRPRNGASEVEALSAECRRLAEALRRQAGDVGWWRRDEAAELRHVACRLDVIGEGITLAFSNGDESRLRGFASWVQRYSALFILPAAALTGVAESAGSNVMDRLWPPEDQPAEVIEAARRVNDQACAILALPSGSLSPSPAPPASAVAGTASADLGSATSTARGLATAAGDVEITDSVVDLEPATLSLDGVDVETSTGEPVDPATVLPTPTLAVGEPSSVHVGDPPQYPVGDVPTTYGSSDPADYDRSSVAGRARRAREGAAADPEIHDTTATAFDGVDGAAQLSGDVTLGLATEQDSARTVNATATPATLRTEVRIPGATAIAAEDHVVKLNDVRGDQDETESTPEDSRPPIAER